MPQINTSLPADLIEDLRKQASNSHESLSKIIKDRIELGVQVHKKKEEIGIKKQQEHPQDLTEKHPEYLLRILGIVSDILRCVHNEKSKYKTDNVESILDKIKENMQQYVRDFNKEAG